MQIEADKSSDQVTLRLSASEASILVSFLVHSKFSDCPRPEIFLHRLLNDLVAGLISEGCKFDDDLNWFRGESLELDFSEDGLQPSAEMLEIKSYVEKNFSPQEREEALRSALYPWIVKAWPQGR